MSYEALQIEFSAVGNVRVLKLIGELDAYTSNQLAVNRQTWLKGAKKLLIDLGELEYIDSSGLAALVRLWVAARDIGVRVEISSTSVRVHRVLDITGLINLFKVREG